MAGHRLDLAGHVYGDLTVVEIANIPRHGTVWLCRCSCGGSAKVRSDQLRNGLRNACTACKSRQRPSRPFARGKRIDLLGRTFGKLTVKALAAPRSQSVYWLCECCCGSGGEYSSFYLRNSPLPQCAACRQHVRLAKAKVPKPPHSRALPSRWKNMMRRCYDPTCRAFPLYGGRGIVVCEEWRTSKAAFVDWGRATGFEPHLSLDRINVNGHYSPENCRWATAKQQIANRRPHFVLRNANDLPERDELTAAANRLLEKAGIR